jgi:hypothetical protein
MYRKDDTVSFIVGMYLSLNEPSLVYVLGSTSGKGLHAENGVSKLRPALEELFDEYVGDFLYRAVFSLPVDF